MKKLVYQNEDAVHQLNTAIERGKVVANELMTMFNALGLKPIETPAQVLAMVDNLPGFIESMLPDKDVKLMGLTLKPARIVELMDLPLQPIKDRIQQATKSLDFQACWQFCEVAKMGKKGLETCPKLIAEKLETYRVYAVSDRALEVAKTYEKLTQAFDELMTYGVSMNQLRGTIYPTFVEYQGGKFVPNPARFKELAGV